MFSLLAFKALRRHGDTLASPQQGTPWERVYIAPLGETYRLEANEADLEREVGIFAASYWEAALYGDDVYIVAPDPARPVIEAEAGWRAGAAFVVAGPFGAANLKEAAQIIIAAYRAGYPQVKAILGWAAVMVQETDIVILCGSVEDLYIYACESPDDKYDPAVLDALLASASGYYLCELGVNLPAERWSEKIVDALINAGDDEHLYRAACNWPRFEPKIVEAFIERADAYYLYKAGKEFVSARWDSRIMTKLCATRDAGCILRAILGWPDARFSPALVEALIETGDEQRLYEGGMYIPARRWDKRIAQRLAKSSSGWLALAQLEWPAERRKELNV